MFTFPAYYLSSPTVNTSLWGYLGNVSGNGDFTKNISAQETIIFGMDFSVDGTKMYICSYYSVIYQYNLSTAWDLSTASYSGKSYNTSIQTGTNTSSVDFSPDGTKMYVSNYIGDSLYQYTLSIPWDVSTAYYTNKSFNPLEANGIGSVQFNSNGTKCYIVNYSNAVYQYSMSVAYDISTTSYDSKSFSITGATSVNQIVISPNGKVLMSHGYGNNKVIRCELSTAWDISTALKESEIAITPYGNGGGLSISQDGTKLYVIGYANNGIVRQYNL